MIKVNDIRPGNIVALCADYTGTPFPISPSSYYRLRHFEDNAETDYRDISLTIQEIERLGFINKIHRWNDFTSSNELYWFGEFYIGFNENKGEKQFFIGKKSRIGSALYLANVSNVRRVQNIYHALTEEELIYTP